MKRIYHRKYFRNWEWSSPLLWNPVRIFSESDWRSCTFWLWTQCLSSFWDWCSKEWIQSRRSCFSSLSWTFCLDLAMWPLPKWSFRGGLIWDIWTPRSRTPWLVLFWCSRFFFWTFEREKRKIWTSFRPDFLMRFYFRISVFSVFSVSFPRFCRFWAGFGLL